MAKTRRGTTLLSAVMAILMVFSIGFAPAAMPAAAYAEEAKSAAVGDAKSAETKEDQKAPEANGSKAPAKEDAKTQEHGDKNDGTDEAARSAKDKGDEDEAPAGPIEAVGEFFQGVADGIGKAATTVVEAVTGTFNMAVKGIKAMLGADTPGNGLKPALKLVWDDNNDEAGLRPTSPVSVGVAFHNEDSQQYESLSTPLDADFAGATEKTLYFGDDEMSYPRIGTQFTYTSTGGSDEVYGYGFWDMGLPHGYSMSMGGEEAVGDYYVYTAYLTYSDPYNFTFDYAGAQPRVSINWTGFTIGETPFPELNQFGIVAYDENENELSSYSRYITVSDMDTSENGGFLWTYKDDTLPAVGENGVHHYAIATPTATDASYSIQRNGYSMGQDLSDPDNPRNYYIINFEGTYNGSDPGGDPGYEPGPSWNPNGDTGVPAMQVSFDNGGNPAAIAQLTASNAITAYPIVDSEGTRGSGVPVTMTASEWGSYDQVLSELAPIDNNSVYGYEFEMPVITNYSMRGPSSWFDGTNLYYAFNYDYDPSPTGLKPAVRIYWNDADNPDHPLQSSWFIQGYDEGGTPISGAYQGFVTSGSGSSGYEMEAITFDSLPAYGDTVGNQTVANSKDGYGYGWNLPVTYSVQETTPEVDSNYYYRNYQVSYTAPVDHSNPTVRLKWIDKGHTSDRPANVNVDLHEPSVDMANALTTATVTGDPDDIYWEYTFNGWPTTPGDPSDYQMHLPDFPYSKPDAGSTNPYYVPWGGQWVRTGSDGMSGDEVYEITIYHRDGYDPMNYNPVPHSNPGIVVWWWDEWWTQTQPEYLDVSLYDNGAFQETKRIIPDYHGETQSTYHGDWHMKFTEYPDENDGHSYSFTIAFPDGYSVPGYDLVPAQSPYSWMENDELTDYDPYDYLGYGYWNQWSIFLVPNTTPYTLTRTDSTGDNSGSSVDLEIAETLPADVGSGRKYVLANSMPAEYPMTSPSGTVTPSAEVSDAITLTYNVTVADGDSLSLNLIKGSNVSIRKAGSSPSIAKVSGTGTDDGSSITFDVGSAALDGTTIEARGAGGSDPSPGVTTEGTITIAQNSMNAGTTYDVYRVFQGPVSTENGQDKASSLAWDANAPQSEILSFLNQNGYQEWLQGAGNANTSLASNPMLAAQFISEKIADTTASPTAVPANGTQPRTTTSDSFASGLARVLVQYGTPQASDATAGTAYTNDQGYYLFVTDVSTIDSGSGNEAGTAPIWAPITNTARVVTEKTEVPTLTSQVTDDDNATPGKTADGNIGQDLTHTLTATLPANVMAYPSYAMTVAETLPSGMGLAGGNASSVAVTLGGVDITNMCGIAYDNDVLTVSASDLRSADVASALSAQGVEFGPDATMVITYNAHLDSDANVGPSANMTSAQLTYTADPNSEANPTSQTPLQNTFTYASAISLEKLDRETRLGLAGVTFTIQDTASGMYVAQDGTLSSSAVNHTTASNTGLIEVSGVDSGTYTIAEVTPVSGYKALSSPITLAITPTYDAAGNLADFAVSATGENFSAVVAPATTVGANEDGVSIVDASLMKAGLRVSNLREIVLPLTGMPLGMGIAVYGSILLAISLAAYVRNKRIKDQIAELENLTD